jgi:hypothetical protein
MASAVLFREAPLGTHGAMADRCECVFDDVRCAIDRSDKVAHPPATNRDRTDAGHDLTLRQVAVAHQTSAAIVRLPRRRVSRAKSLPRLRPPARAASRAIAQHLGQRISKSSWLGQLQNVSVGMAYRSRVEASNSRYATTSLHAVTNFRI